MPRDWGRKDLRKGGEKGKSRASATSDIFSRHWLSIQSYKLNGGGGRLGPDAKLEPLASIWRIVSAQ